MFNNNLTMNNKLIISEFKTIRQKYLSEDLSINEIRSMCEEMEKINEKFKKLDNVERLMKAYNDYSKKQQTNKTITTEKITPTKKQMQDLSKFTSTITNYTIFYEGYNTHDKPALCVTLETVKFSLTYSVYLFSTSLDEQIQGVEFLIDNCVEKFSIYRDEDSPRNTKDIYGNKNLLKEIYKSFNFNVLTYDNFLDILFDIIKCLQINKYVHTLEPSDWKFIRQNDLRWFKKILLI